VRRYDHFIGGAPCAPSSGELIDRFSPATGALVATFAAGNGRDVDTAVLSARTAFDHGPWAKMSGIDRSRLLRAFADLMLTRLETLAQIESEEVGKPIRYARKDIEGGAKVIHYAAGLAADLHGIAYPALKPGQTGLVMREPAGVVGAIIPWNFPAFVFCHKVPFALAAGCTVVVKPSEFTSGTALELARLATEAGIPPGVVNVVTGYGAAAGSALVDHPGVDMVSFTGSTATGRKVMQAAIATTKRVALELGGKGANIVFADAEMEDAIDGTLFGVFHNTGQVCSAGSRLIIDDAIADGFLARLKQAVGGIRIGDPADDATDVGSLIHAAALDKVAAYVEGSAADGVVTYAGGERLSGGLYDRGSFYAPTILDRVAPSARVHREEIFGPVLAVTRFRSTEEAVALANDTSYGLANALWTRDVDKAMGVSSALRSGVVWVNTTLDGSPQMPFGGRHQSGFGREFGRAGLEEFTEVKSIFLSTGRRTPEFYGRTS
jgi:acyl-CoA reductase-like NAD-dependent aldehyde dehydrogenase